MVAETFVETSSSSSAALEWKKDILGFKVKGE